MRKLAISLFLMLMSTAAFAAKPSIGVSEFKNETSAGWWSSDVGEDLAGMLTNELAGLEKFKVVERAKLGPVLDEQNLADSGRINKSTGAKIGKLTGAQYLVFATVTSFDTQSRGTGGGVSFRGISVGGKKEDAYIAVDLRVVDTTTGEIAYSRTVEARAGSYGVSGGIYRGGFGGNLSKYENTPTGKAIRAVVMEISEYLGCVMVDQDGCESDYAAKEKSRRDKTKKAIKLD
ncbi:MAG TPA: CsgG/HfaB family protein [Thermoanaerobaculia bacterium]|jgi:curli biogenesis system outer membrane secretion channel CsgG